MIENRSSELAVLVERIAQMHDFLHIEEKKEQIQALTQRSSAAGFWDKAQEAQAVMSLLATYRDELDLYEDLVARISDLEVACELAYAENDEELAAEVDESIASIERDIDTLEVSSWFTGEFDAEDAIVTVTPGQGGLEAQDWCEILFKMYLRYAESKKWKVEVHDLDYGESIGLNRATFTIKGKNAYGMLRSEQGVHRLVRISPTDLKKRRQTTFAGVTVMPVLPSDIVVDIKEEDVRIDVYRSSGPGGQSVNTTDSAVRLTHIPTGIVVTVQNEKSQHKNKEAAFKILKSRIYEAERLKREEELAELRGPKMDITWGSQIRNYVLYPYQLVKDLRSGIESGNVEAVLGGDIERFVIGYHRWKASGAQIQVISEEDDSSDS